MAMRRHKTPIFHFSLVQEHEKPQFRAAMIQDTTHKQYVNAIILLFLPAYKKDAQDVDTNWKQDTLIRSSEFQRMMDRISDVEKCLAKISELKEVYNKMDGYWSYQEKLTSRKREIGHENSAYKTSLEMTTSDIKQWMMYYFKRQ